MPSDLDNLFTAALKEAMTLAPSDDVILETIELRQSGLGAPVRYVADYGRDMISADPLVMGHFLTLELNAPANAIVQDQRTVPFVGVMFDLTPPQLEDGATGTLQIVVDNAAAELSEQLDATLEAGVPIEVTYRQYLDSDHSQPASVLNGLTIQEVDSDVSRVTATAAYADHANKSFPGILYQPAIYPTLSE